MDRRLFLLNSVVLLAGCSTTTQLRETYDLAPISKNVISASRSTKQLTIAEPKTLASLDTERMAIVQDGGGIAYLPDGSYADRLPKLVQSRLIYLFENSNRLGSVGRPGDRISSDYQLLIDIRSFHIDAANGVAVIEVSAKLMNDRNGRIIDSAIFGERAPSSGTTAALAAKALEEALSALLVQVVQWVVKKV